MHDGFLVRNLTLFLFSAEKMRSFYTHIFLQISPNRTASPRRVRCVWAFEAHTDRTRILRVFHMAKANIFILTIDIRSRLLTYTYRMWGLHVKSKMAEKEGKRPIDCITEMRFLAVLVFVLFRNSSDRVLWEREDIQQRFLAYI